MNNTYRIYIRTQDNKTISITELKGYSFAIDMFILQMNKYSDYIVDLLDWSTGEIIETNCEIQGTYVPFILAAECGALKG